MPYVMTQHGSLDNQVTNTFFCDEVEDLTQIPSKEITFGSVAVVLDGMQIFIANSKKEWKSMTPLSDEDTTSA